MDRLLLVDDDTVDRKVIQRLLRDSGPFDVVEAASGAEALAALAAAPVDCALVDFRLPDMDGLALLGRISAQGHSAPPVIMLTGEGNELVAVQAMKSGAEDYLPKAGLTHEVLLRAIANAIEKHRIRGELAQVRQQLERMALYDSLTGLGNRNLFETHLRRVLASATRNGATAGLMLMDLDKFKEVNDTHGHEAGDAVLAAVGQRLLRLGREADAFFRLGGDEFAAVVDTSAAGIEVLARKIIKGISAPVAYHDLQLCVGISIGFALFPEHGDNPDDLLRLADAAMYAAKRGHLQLAAAPCEGRSP